MASQIARPIDARLAAGSVARARESLAESIRVKRALLETRVDVIAAVGDRVAAAFAAGHKALLFGNGGSAADAQHIAAEWVGRFGADRRALPALALTANPSNLTAVANDFGFEHVFVREIEAHGRTGRRGDRDQHVGDLCQRARRAARGARAGIALRRTDRAEL